MQMPRTVRLGTSNSEEPFAVELTDDNVVQHHGQMEHTHDRRHFFTDVSDQLRQGIGVVDITLRHTNFDSQLAQFIQRFARVVGLWAAAAQHHQVFRATVGQPASSLQANPAERTG